MVLRQDRWTVGHGSLLGQGLGRRGGLNFGEVGSHSLVRPYRKEETQELGCSPSNARRYRQVLSVCRKGSTWDAEGFQPGTEKPEVSGSFEGQRTHDKTLKQPMKYPALPMSNFSLDQRSKSEIELRDCQFRVMTGTSFTQPYEKKLVHFPSLWNGTPFREGYFSRARH